MTRQELRGVRAALSRSESANGSVALSLNRAIAELLRLAGLRKTRLTLLWGGRVFQALYFDQVTLSR